MTNVLTVEGAGPTAILPFRAPALALISIVAAQANLLFGLSGMVRSIKPLSATLHFRDAPDLAGGYRIGKVAFPPDASRRKK